MDKKDIYEHLAKIYLDASLKRKNKVKKFPAFKYLFVVSLLVIVTLSISLIFSLNKDKFQASNAQQNKTIKSELALVLQPDVVKINFNFDPAKEEAYSVNLNKLNLTRFKTLGFSVRKADYEDNIILKIIFTNTLNEKSEVSIANIPAYKWMESKINLCDFKNITDWAGMSTLSFTIDIWNTKEKKGIAYIDNIRFLK